jgi:succinate dehydrogenase/fumarate reductase flavoprotein subunit
MTKTFGTWANPPEPIPDGEVAERYAADVVVCGAGISGVACALRAAQNGAEVIVLEKSLRWSGRGGNIGVVNSTYMSERGYENDPEAVAREWIKRCGNRCDEKILWRYLHESPRVMDWLVDIVTQPEYGCRPALQGCLYRGEPYWELPGSHRFFGGPMEAKGQRAGAADAVFAMYGEACKSGVRFLFETAALQLEKDAGRVLGVYAREKNGRTIYFEARKGVVLATGDIGGNEAMCAELSPLANRVKKIYGPKGGNLGDGHRMGLWAGAVFEDTPFPTIMHPQAYHYSNFPFLHVTPEGKRYYNEDNFVQGKSLAILREGFSYA